MLSRFISYYQDPYTYIYIYISVLLSSNENVIGFLRELLPQAVARLGKSVSHIRCRARAESWETYVAHFAVDLQTRAGGL